MRVFPHLKECGPIEARLSFEVFPLSSDSFPHLKECGPIEAMGPMSVFTLQTPFPHLKECGPIEASKPIGNTFRDHLLSALERVRPH